jgi:hypothetical protein
MTIYLVVGRPVTLTLSAPGVRYGESVNVYYYSPPATSYLLLGSGTAPEDDKLTATLTIWEVVSDQPVVILRGRNIVEIERVTSRYPKLTVKVVDQDGKLLDGVEVGVRAGTRTWFTYHGYTSNGVITFDIDMVFDELHVYGRKEYYDEYPYWSYFGDVPPLKDVGDYTLSAVMKYTGTPPPPPTPITVTVRVYDAYIFAPIAGASVKIDTTSGSTDSSGLAKLTLPSAGIYTVTVTKDGYESYNQQLELVNGSEVGVALKPKITLPTITLSVDKTTINEGEIVTFTVSPSDINVDLYELVGAEKVYIKSFTGQTTLQPQVGTHTYAVKYLFVYGSYSAEIWSNVVSVEVVAGIVTTPNWTVSVLVQAMGQPVGAGEAEGELRETTSWQTSKHNYGPIPTDSSGRIIFTGVCGTYYRAGSKYSVMTYDLIVRLKVQKGPIPAGRELRVGLILEDSTYKVVAR